MNKIGNFKDTDGNNLLGLNFASNIITKDGQSVDDALDKKVDKETGKGLSSNDYTNEDKNKVQSSISYNRMAWGELRGMMQNNGLEKGAFYEITDYVTHTKSNQEYTSAEFPFTIIVQATSTNTLSEDAKCGYSTLTNGNYFSENNANLKAWEIKYCIDNDTQRFEWVDDNCKGVIYYMKDEWGNECPYDFKNIKFKRYPILTIPNGSTKLVYNVNNQKTKYGLKDQSGTIFPQGATIDESNSSFYYTFNAIDSSDNNIYDASIIQVGITDDKNGDFIVQNNIIKELYTSINSSEDDYDYGQVLNLNNICINNVIKDLTHTELSFGCDSNTFGNSCHSNTFGNNCGPNTFGNSCYSNIFGNNCYSNTFGNYCSSNIFGDSCVSNTFGNNCYENTSGNYCVSNTFGNYCTSNTFGKNYYYNTFGNYCVSNTFGNNCHYNTFGNDCDYNTFGNNCDSNTFGNYCSSNNFYNGVNGTTPKDFIKYLKLEDGVRNNNFYSNLPTSGTSYLQRIRIRGLEHTTPTNTQITLSSVNTKYEWLVFYLNGGVLKQYCIEDHLSTNDYTDEEKSKLQGLSNYDDTIIKNELANKVDKIDGKGLSSNDYTDGEKSKLQGLSNYDDTIIKNELANKVDKIDGKGLSTNDLTDELKDKIEIQPTPLKNATYAEDLYKIMVDQFGRITKAVKVTNDEISEKVNVISTENIDTLEF